MYALIPRNHPGMLALWLGGNRSTQANPVFFFNGVVVMADVERLNSRCSHRVGASTLALHIKALGQFIWLVWSPACKANYKLLVDPELKSIIDNYKLKLNITMSF